MKLGFFTKARSFDPVANRRQRHREMLFFAFVVVVGAAVLEVRPDQRVAFRGLSSTPLPPSCVSHELFGIPCPGCGLTRSIIYLAHGQWRASLAMHRLGWLMALAALLQIPYRIQALRQDDATYLPPRFTRGFGKTLVALLMINWVVGFFV